MANLFKIPRALERTDRYPMSPTKIFLTGGTGYIGGSVLHTLATEHPEYSITVLLRNPPPTFSAQYPKVKIIRGDYDSAEILREAASKANIVIHCGDSDHQPSIIALLSGLLSQKPSPSGPYLIHLSGTALISDVHDPTHHGHLNPKIWSDVHDITTITSLPDIAPHRPVDKLILAAAAQHGLKTAIVCPPDIYGKGTGPGKIRSIFMPVFVDAIRKEVGRGFYVGEGGNVKSWVHVEDLMDIYRRLVEDAVEGGGRADWGKEGYYFASSQEHSHVSVARKVGELMLKYGMVEHAEPVKVSLQTVDDLVKMDRFEHVGTYLFAASARSRSDRAREKLGYVSSAPGLMECLEVELLGCME